MTCQIQYEITGLANLRPLSPRAQKGRRRSPKLRNHEASPRFQCESKILQIGSNHHTDDTLRWKVITTDDMPKLGKVRLNFPPRSVRKFELLAGTPARDFARFDGRSSHIYVFGPARLPVPPGPIHSPATACSHAKDVANWRTVGARPTVIHSCRYTTRSHLDDTLDCGHSQDHVPEVAGVQHPLACGRPAREVLGDKARRA